MPILNIFGHLLTLDNGIEWEVARPSPGDESEGLSIKFPFHRQTPTARDARQIVARSLRNTANVDWLHIRGSTWLVDLSKIRERFKLNLDWLQGTVVIEPDYDIVSNPFHPEERHGVLALVFERDVLQAAPESSWDDYPEDDAAELVPLLRRRAFDRDVERLFQGAGEERVAALAMIDIDHFKRVNDEYGHPTGDGVLIRVAEIVRTITGRRGRGYRYGGEELAILLPDFTLAEAMPLVERIRQAVHAEAWPTFEGLHVTVSAGVTAAKGATAPAFVVGAADKALYAAKRGGRNRVESA